MSEFRTACKVSEVKEGEAKAIAIGNKIIALFRVQDRFFAIDDVCPHMGASLSEGEVEAGVVTCPWHAWRFRLADGAWADNPRLKTGSYPVRVVGDDVQIQVGSGIRDQGSGIRSQESGVSNQESEGGKESCSE